MFIDDCLNRKVIFFTGKGGVGKTSLAWATALACRRRGLSVTIASWNPFNDEKSPILVVDPQISWVPLETVACFKEYALRMLKFETIYNVAFDNYVLKTFIRAAPGLSETVIAGKVWDLYHQGTQDLLIVDLPSSGHAHSFFKSPLGVQKIFTLGFVNRETGKLSVGVQAETTRIDLVTLPEELPMVETRELKQTLDRILPFHYGYLHVNQRAPYFSITSDVVPALPSPVRECYERHEERLASENEALELADKIGLRQIFIPRFASDSMQEILERMAQQLERAEEI